MTDSTRKDTISPLVSVVIPTFNSEHTLSSCLQSIQNQTYPKIEVLIVDNYSTDSTTEIAKKFNAKVLLLKSERSAAKNHGVANAKGSFIFFVDSDMTLTPKVIEECITTYLHQDVDAVDIPEVSVAKGFLSECKKIEKALYIRDPNSFKMPRFFKKEVFNLVGGFDTNLIFGEDFDLGRRVEDAGYKIGRCKAEIKHHEGRLSMKRIALKAYYYGKTLSHVIEKNPSFAMKAYCPTRYFRIFRLLHKHPTHSTGLLIIKLVQYISYLIAILSTTFNESQ